MALEIIGYVSHTRHTDTSGLWWSAEFDPDYIALTAQAHEEAGFDAVLVGSDSWGPDSWQVAAHVLRSTRKLKVLVAHRPGFVQPTVAARQAITLQRLFGPRVALHIITGSAGGELQRDGDTLDPALRYARTDEYMALLKRLWSAIEPFDHSGEFYRFRQGFSAIRPEAPLRLSFAGSSPEALRVGAKHADLYMLWGEPLAGVAQVIDTVHANASAAGTQSPRFSVSLRAVVGATEQAAWQKAQGIYQRAATELAKSREAPEALQQNAFGLASEGAKRLDDYARDGDVQDERLWLGFTRLVGRGGSTSALVGTAEQIAQAYRRYHALGARSLYLRGWDIAKDAREYGEELIPALRAAVSHS